MRKWITFLMTLLVGSSLSYANAESSQVTFEAGYRRDNINWTVATPSCDPIFKETTKFEDLDIFQIGVKARTLVGCNFYVRASAYWGWILDGDFKHSISFYDNLSFFEDDFSEDIAFTTTQNQVIDDKYVYDLNIALGYSFYFCDCTIAISPVVGYAVDEQILCVDYEGFDFDTFGSLVFPTSGSDCCCHKFHNRWYGPFIGLDLLYRPCGECWSLYGELEYHYAQFKAKFHNDFDFFGDNNNSHRSHHARGWVFALGADYDFCCDWTFGLSLKYQDWRAHRSHKNSCCDDEFNQFFGSCCSTREHTKNKWRALSINVALSKCF